MVQYNNVRQIDRDGVATMALGSDVFDRFYLQSAVGCAYHSEQRWCQVLANLCVLQLYNERTIPCRFFRSLEGKITELST